MAQCRSCRAIVPDTGGGSSSPVCDQCFAASLGARLQLAAALPAPAHTRVGRPGLGFIVGGGVVAALAGGILWYGLATGSGDRLPIMAVVLGWLVGMAVIKASDGRGGPTYAALSCLLTAASLVIVDYLLLRGAGGAPSRPLVVGLGELAELLEGDLRGHQRDIGWWSLALLSAWVLPSRRLA